MYLTTKILYISFSETVPPHLSPKKIRWVYHHKLDMLPTKTKHRSHALLGICSSCLVPRCCGGEKTAIRWWPIRTPTIGWQCLPWWPKRQKCLIQWAPRTQSRWIKIRMTCVLLLDFPGVWWILRGFVFYGEKWGSSWVPVDGLSYLAYQGGWANKSVLETQVKVIVVNPVSS